MNPWLIVLIASSFGIALLIIDGALRWDHIRREANAVKGVTDTDDLTALMDGLYDDD